MKFRKYLSLVLVWGLLVVMAGCATGGSSSSSSSGRSRGSLSQATKSSADSTDKEETTGRGEGRTRTRNDTGGQTKNDDAHQEEYYEDYYEEDNSWKPFVFLFGLISSLFSSGEKEEETYDPYDYQTFSDTSDNPGEYESWTNADEFGLPPAEEKENGESDYDGQDKNGGGQDNRRRNLIFWYSRSTLGGDAIQSFTTYTLMYSAYPGRRYRAHAGLYYGQGEKGSQPDIQEGIRWISEAGLELGARGYLTSDRSRLGFYVILGLRTGPVSWSYVNAVEAPNDDGTTESISTDSLWLVVPYVGLGSSLLQTQKVHLGLSFTIGGRIYSDRTAEDFSNDLFKDVPEYKLNFEASYFF